MGYIYNFLSWWEKNEGEKLKDAEWRLPAVIPLIVYHGDKEWEGFRLRYIAQ
ncbi:hypothetical protein CCP2SC5_590007 [Azospirillaceae bacterium]